MEEPNTSPFITVPAPLWFSLFTPFRKKIRILRNRVLPMAAFSFLLDPIPKPRSFGRRRDRKTASKRRSDQVPKAKGSGEKRSERERQRQRPSGVFKKWSSVSVSLWSEPRTGKRLLKSSISEFQVSSAEWVSECWAWYDWNSEVNWMNMHE